MHDVRDSLLGLCNQESESPLNYPDPSVITENAGAFAAAFNAVRSMLGVFKDAKDLLPEGKREAVEKAVEASERQLKIAEAEIATALGYKLCQCQFPPNIMLSVGVIARHSTRTNERVYECTVCGADTAHPFGFDRFVPKSTG